MGNPLSKITDTAVGIVASGVRVVASLINATADQAKDLVGKSDESGAQKQKAPQPGGAQEPKPQEPFGEGPTIEEMAAAAVEREMQQEPLGGPAASDSAPEGDELLTPSGIPAAGPGVNPATTQTDLHQPDTEPLLDPATVKAAKKEADVARAGAERKKT